MYAILVTLFLVTIEAIAIFFAYRAITQARTPQGSIGWVVFLVAAPHFAVPAYVFLGHYRYRGYISARREAAGVIVKMFSPADGPSHIAETTHAAEIAYRRLAEVPVVSGNAVDILIDGDETFGAIFSAIDAAQTYVVIQYFIIHDDELGRELKSKLIARAQDGLKIRLLYDAIGCASTPRAYWHDLRQGGIEVHDIHSLRRSANRFQVNFRNHRKIVITDGTTGFVGGLNVGDEYMGRDPKFGRWRDTYCRIRGPMVSQLQLIFAEDWYWATNEVLSDDLNWTPVHSGTDTRGLVLASGPGDARETGTLYFCNAIASAESRVWIATPYFVPDIDILTALKLAALRGIDVRILVPDMVDHKVVWFAAFAYFDEVRAAGVKIWRYDAGFLHQKVIVVDDDITAIGTLNLDNRSCRLNFEVAAIVFDRDLTAKATEMLEEDFRNAHLHEIPLDKQPFKIRFGAPVARLCAPVL